MPNSPQQDLVVGSVVGTGAALNVSLGFKPRYVKVYNPSDAESYFPIMEWFEGMAAASGIKTLQENGPICLGSAGLAIGSGSKKEVKVVNTTPFRIAGVLYTKASAEVGFTATTHDIAAHATLVQEACYLITVNAGGTLAITMGAIATGAGNAVVPECPADVCQIGYVRIAVAGGSTLFDATTDDLDRAGLTVTYVNLAKALGAQKVTANGITQYAGSQNVAAEGFTIGADKDLNVSGETLYYLALR